jgi:hypothetical protein
MIIRLILFLILSLNCYAEEAPSKGISGYDPGKDVIADNYEAGAWLIYDCKEKHWTCVLESYFIDCSEKRKLELIDQDTPLHSCAPLSQYPNKRSCFQKVLYLTSQNFGNRFCVKEFWKQKAVTP